MTLPFCPSLFFILAQFFQRWIPTDELLFALEAVDTRIERCIDAFGACLTNRLSTVHFPLTVVSQSGGRDLYASGRRAKGWQCSLSLQQVTVFRSALRVAWYGERNGTAAAAPAQGNDGTVALAACAFSAT